MHATRSKVGESPSPSGAHTPAEKLLALQAAVAQGGISSVMEGAGDANGATGFGEAAGEAAFGLGAVEVQAADAAPGATAKAGGPGAKAGGPGSKSERGGGGRGKGGGKGGGGGGKGGGMPMGMMSGMMGVGDAPRPAGGFQVLMQGWPAMDSTSGRKMATLCEQPGIIRHDIRVAKPIVGRLIGSGGATFRDLSQRTGASIFVLDKEGPPPGWSNDWRLVIIMGYEAQVIHAIQEVETLIGSSPLLTGAGAAPKPAMQGGYGGYAGYGAPGQIGAAGPPGQTASGLGAILVTGWPTAAEPSGRRMASLEQTPGMIRHDMLVLKPYVGRLIGQGGATYRELQTRTGCTIFILDKEGPPPGFPDDQRLVSLMGFEPQVVQAEAEVTALLSSASQRPPTAGKGGGASTGGGRGSGGYGGGMGGMYGQQAPAPFCDVTTMGGGGAYPGAAAGYGGYAAPAPLGYGAPAPVAYGAPTAGAYGAAAPGGYGAPAQGAYGAPAPTGYAPPATTGYGGYGGYAAPPADPYAAAGALGAGYGAAAGAAGAAYGAADPAYAGGAPAYYNDANYAAGGAYGEYEQRGVKRTAYGQ